MFIEKNDQRSWIKHLHYDTDSLTESLGKLRQGQIEALVVDGLPTTDAESTRALLSCVYASQTMPYNIAIESNGQFIADLRPRRAGPIGPGKSAISWHSEGSHLNEAAADWVWLLGIVGDGTLTGASSVSRALSHISATDQALLRKPLFDLSVPLLWRDDFKDKVQRVSVLSGNRLRLALYAGIQKGVDEASQQALVRFGIALSAESIAIELVAGRLFVINNRRCAHARLGRLSTKRHIKRIFSRVDLAALDTHLTSLGQGLYGPAIGK